MVHSKPASAAGHSGIGDEPGCHIAKHRVMAGGVNKSLRKTGIEIIGDVPWGTHFCQFYQTKQDLIDTLVPYIKNGLESNEFCMWVTADNLSQAEAEQALRSAIPDYDYYVEREALVLLPYTEWYLDEERFDRHRVLNSWVERLNNALARGYDGVRVTGDTMWLNKSHWQDFKDYEASINTVIGDHPLLVLCTYSLDKCGASEIADVIANHDFALMKRYGEWTMVENSSVRQAKQALQDALDELDAKNQTLEDINAELKASTEQLEAINKELREAENELRKEIEERKRAEVELQRLNRILIAHSKSGHAMIRATSESEYLQNVCRIIEEDCGYSMVWIGFAEDDEAKTVRPAAYSGYNDGYVESLNISWADTIHGRGPTGTAIRTGKPCTCRNILTDPQFELWRAQALKRGYVSTIALPLISDGKIFGAISIYSNEPDPFTEDEIVLLKGLADDLAYGITAIRLRAAKSAIDQQREDLYKRERHIVETLQETLVPQDVPKELYGCKLGMKYQPALREAEIGGDFFDVFDLKHGRVGIIIGDVAGKGLQAAVRVAEARYTIRSYAYEDASPAVILARTNDVLNKERYAVSAMLTVFFAVVDTVSQTITYANAGHEPPVVIRTDCSWRELATTGLPIGITPGICYSEEVFHLASGDRVVMITDGVTEARANEADLFGKRKVIECLVDGCNVSESDLACRLLEAAAAHAGGHLQDDAAIVVFTMR